MECALAVLAGAAFVALIWTAILRALRRSDRDDYFDKPENWGDL